MAAMAKARARQITHRRHPASIERHHKKLEDEEDIDEALSQDLANQPWSPSAYSVFKAILSARLVSCLWSNVSDCDETYNYWEPLHYLLYGKGFQTWEYSPAYAIRSYAYLWLHALPIQPYARVFQANKIFVFYMLRLMLSFVCSVCETYFYRAVCRQFGANVGRLCAAFLVCSTGMYIAGCALLPSTFSMYCNMLAFTGWFVNDKRVAILFTALSGVVGWPFAGVLAVPLAADYVIRRGQLWSVVRWALALGVVVVLPVVWIDTAHFGRWTLAAWNIVTYNVLTTHGADLYGTEPWSFYFINLLLNFNIVFPLAMSALPLTMITKRLINIPDPGIPFFIPGWVRLCAMYLWMIIMFVQSHKEERFLFPIYPLVCLNAAVAWDALQKLSVFAFVKRKEHDYTHYTNKYSWAMVLVFLVVSLSRGFALYKHYHAPLDVYWHFYETVNNRSMTSTSKDMTLCVGKEWYRFPGNFFVPTDGWRVAFIRSDFTGQLPKAFADGDDATRVMPSHMNDQNIEEVSRYVDVRQCHYLVDVDTGRESPREPNYSKLNDAWTVVFSQPFLAAYKSPQIYRAFYIPHLSPTKCTFHSYNLLKAVSRPKIAR